MAVIDHDLEHIDSMHVLSPNVNDPLHGNEMVPEPNLYKNYAPKARNRKTRFHWLSQTLLQFFADSQVAISGLAEKRIGAAQFASFATQILLAQMVMVAVSLRWPRN